MSINPIGINLVQVKYTTYNNRVNSNRCCLPVPSCDTIAFTGVRHGAQKLKKLASYGVTDMYTGRLMLDAKKFEQWQQSDLFSKSIKQILHVTRHSKKTLGNVEFQVYEILEQEAKKTPHDTLEMIIKRIKPKYEKELLSKQQPIFEKLIQVACKMPSDRFNEFIKLMDVTSKKIENNPVVLPFSEREFRYKLSRIASEIESKNDKDEVVAINKIKRIVSYMFPSGKPTSRFVVKNSKLKKYTRNQKSASVIKANAIKLNKIDEYFKTSPLSDNKELIELFQDVRARIYGFPTYAPFKRKPFIHDLDKITDTLDDKALAHELHDIAVSLPRAKDDVSAFIVKVSGSTGSKIGYDLFSEAVCSVDHLKAENNGGISSLGNYGLCSKGINSEKSNMCFADWIEKNPQSRENIQKYVDKLIFLYKNGVFKEIGLRRSYIEDFAYTVENLTKDSKHPLKLNISNLYSP